MVAGRPFGKKPHTNGLRTDRAPDPLSVEGRDYGIRTIPYSEHGREVNNAVADLGGPQPITEMGRSPARTTPQSVGTVADVGGPQPITEDGRPAVRTNPESMGTVADLGMAQPLVETG